MGFLGNLSAKIRRGLSQDKEGQVKRLAKGATASSALMGYGRDMFSVFGYDSQATHMNVENDLISRFADYEEMDDRPELATSINILADEMMQPDYEKGKSIWVESPDKTVENMLDNDLMSKRLRMSEEEGWGIARQVVKMGNDYEELLVDHTGVVGLNYLPPATVRRVEGPRGELYGFVQDFRGKYGFGPREFQELMQSRNQSSAYRDPNNKKPLDWNKPTHQRAVAFEDWEVIHFRNQSKTRRSIYGHSELEPARWIWKRLELLEDTATMFRLEKGAERYAFYVDTGALPPREAFAMVNKVRQKYKKKQYFDPRTGRLNLKWEPLSQLDDFFIPVRNGQESTRIEVLGTPQWQAMEDIEFFRDKMFAGIGLPKAYLAQDADVARQILSNQDVVVARKVLRLQQVMKNGCHRICKIHLSALGIDPSQVEYIVHMASPTSLYELAHLEVMNARADFAGRMRAFVSDYWILSNIFKLNDEDIAAIMKQQADQIARQTELSSQQQISQAQSMQKAGLVPDSKWSNGVPAEGSSSVATGQEVDQAVEALAYGREDLSSGRIPMNVMHERYNRKNWEESLHRGDRKAEREASKHLKELLKQNKALNMKLDETRGFLRELAQACKRK